MGLKSAFNFGMNPCDVIADIARYVTEKSRREKPSAVGQAIPPLPYGENKRSKRNCFLQTEKYFFQAGDRLETHGLTDGEIPLYHMEKSRG